ncbi:MAG: VOC family protein [Elusimicrobia bacterium]|nr:VOC family protein [Elusimicrobiota bacterium]
MIKALGHVVFKVRSLERSVPFYRDILGMREVARYGDSMVFFSLGQNHHDLALMELPGAVSGSAASVGLYHAAFKVGDNLADLGAFKNYLESRDVVILGVSDHVVSQSLYVVDPDGIELEFYVDADPKIWKENPSAVASIRPLQLP